MDRLQKVNKDLKQYKNVNKKAFEQYNNFTKQRSDLRKRRQELNSSQSSIQSLIDHLDRKKDEAIERTFRQVSKEFAMVFEKLVPAGMGRLIIQRKSDQQARADLDDDDSEEERHTVENYSGVGISVSFNSKHDEQQRIQQLSGGQKSKFTVYIAVYSVTNLLQVFVPSHSSSPSSNAIPRPSTSSTKLTPIWTRSTARPSHRC